MLDETRRGAPENHLNCALFHFRLISSYCTRISSDLYQRRVGLTLGECNCLTLLAELGTMSIVDLADRAMLDRALASRIVTDLAAQALLRRNQNPKDARSVAIELTDAGRRMANDIAEISGEMNDFLLLSLTAGERAILPSILKRLSSHSHNALAHLKRRKK